MSNLLSIEVSPRGVQSISRAVGNRFIEHWKEAHPEGTVVHRDLVANKVPYIDTDWILGVYGPPEMVRTPEMNAALATSSELIEELQAADYILISTPMYNYTMPAVLKSWLDYIARPRLTFTLAEGGLLKNKIAKILVISRDTYTEEGTPGEASDFVSPVLRRILAFIGITDVEVVLVGGSFGVNTGKVKLEDHLGGFESAIAQLARR